MPEHRRIWKKSSVLTGKFCQVPREQNGQGGAWKAEPTQEKVEVHIWQLKEGIRELGTQDTTTRRKQELITKENLTRTLFLPGP